MNPRAHVDFWSLAFAGATPPEALGIALKEGLIPDQALDTHASEWFEAWISGLEDRFNATYDLQHRPWRRAAEAGQASSCQLLSQPPRLNDLTQDHPDQGLVSVFEGMLSRGHNPYGPLKTLKHLGGSGVAACVALNLPAGIDLLAQHHPRMDVGDLNKQTAPEFTLGERVALPWLHAAALGWQDTLLEALLDYGLDPNQPDSKGQTPLFYARTQRAVEVLVNAGADIGAKDKLDRTAAQAWAQAKPDSFPRNHTAERLTKTLGEEALSPEEQEAALVRYVSKAPIRPDLMEEWTAKLPQTGEPIHQARMSAGGIWKGTWSPAAWLGLQILQGNIYSTPQLPWLLKQAAFLSPNDFSPKGKLTEKGLLGLGMAEMLGDGPPTFNAHNPDNSAIRFELVEVLESQWGADWFWESPWTESIHQTSRALLSPKSTSQQMRDSIETAWLNRFTIARSDAKLAQRLWEARASGATRMVRHHWEALLSGLPKPLMATLMLTALGDKLEAEDREIKGHEVDLDSFLSYGQGRALWNQVCGLLKATDGYMEKPDPRLDDTLETLLTRLEMSSAAREALKGLRARALDKTLPAATAPKLKSRL